MKRRDLFALLGSLLPGCRSPEPAAPHGGPEPEVEVARLTDLLPAAGIEWLVMVRPRELDRLAWLKPSLARVFRDDRLEQLADETGIDLRAVPEMALASYRERSDSAVAYLVRLQGDPLQIERKFRQRLTSDEERLTLGRQLTLVWGRIGRSLHGYFAVGPHVCGYQYGGDKRHGPARVALLLAEHRLRAPTALADPVLGMLDARLGRAPVKAFLPGPFEGELKRGARGLFGAALAVAASLTPSEAQTLALDVLLAGSYPPDEAPRFLEGAWHDLATSDVGHLLGLAAAKSAPAVKVLPDAIALRVELDAALLLAGLAAATSDSVKDMMR